MTSDDMIGFDGIDEYTDKETYEGIEHFNDYVKNFNEVCYNSQTAAQLTYHILLGQVLRDIFIRRGSDEIDLRVHGIVIGPSGSGKSKSGYFLESIAFDSELVSMRLTDFTDSGLIGSFEPPRKRSDEPHKNEGILEHADIIYLDEARILFKENVNSKKALMYLQTGMNTIGQNRLFKAMRYGTIDFLPRFSIYSVTTPIRDIHHYINFGFFQRQIIFFESEDIGRRVTNLNTDIDRVSFEMNVEEMARFRERVNKVRSRLGRGFRDIKYYAMREKIKEGEGVKEEIRSSMESLMKVAKSIYSPHVKEIAISFVSRVLENMYKLSVHSALMNKRSSVTVDDVKYAYELVLKCFKSMIRYLEEHIRTYYRDEVLDKNRKSALVRLLMVKENCEMRSGELTKELMILWESSKPTVMKYMSKLVETGFLVKEARKGQKTREVYYMLNPTIREYGGYE
jgi:hypothetical protein